MNKNLPASWQKVRNSTGSPGFILVLIYGAVTFFLFDIQAVKYFCEIFFLIVFLVRILKSNEPK
jgi:uncharacterized membrane protein YgaE (UPF0421/DUF939 family)